MNNDDMGCFLFGFIFCIGFILGSIMINEVNKPMIKELEQLKKQAIEHNYAGYDSKTGEFHWLEK